MTDYNDYDYMHAVLKKKYAEQLKECYRAFGWEIVVREEDGRYDDVYNVKFRRPHRIEHKDELQYLQVELEANFDKVSKINRPFYPKSFLIRLFSIILSLGMIAGGLCVIFLIGTAPAGIGGAVLAGIGSGSFIAGLTAAHKVRVKEVAEAKKLTEKLYVRAKEICGKASELTGEAYEGL